jgi:PleD family two-component response regulator
VLRRQVEELLHQRDQVSRRFDALRVEIDREVSKRSEGLFEEVARLRERNPYDEESQLYNRIAITQRLEEELARSERYGLLCSFALLRIVDLSHIDAPGGAIERLSALLRLSLRRFDAAGRWTKDTFAKRGLRLVSNITGMRRRLGLNDYDGEFASLTGRCGLPKFRMLNS